MRCVAGGERGEKKNEEAFPPRSVPTSEPALASSDSASVLTPAVGVISEAVRSSDCCHCRYSRWLQYAALDAFLKPHAQASASDVSSLRATVPSAAPARWLPTTAGACAPRPWLWRSPGGRGAQVAETLEAWPTHMSAIALHVLTAPVHVMLGNVWLGNSNSRARPSTASRQTPMGA